MKTYDFAKAKQLIEQNKDNIETAYLGMSEDWSWTAVAVFEDGQFCSKATQWDVHGA